MFGGIVDPEAGLGREPIELTEPIGGGFETGVVEDFGFAVAVSVVAITGGGMRAFGPFVTVPLPTAFIAIAGGEEAEADGFVAEFKDELRDGGVRDAELFPVGAVFAVGTAEVGEETMREAADGEEWLGEPGGEEFVGRRVAD